MRGTGGAEEARSRIVTLLGLHILQLGLCAAKPTKTARSGSPGLLLRLLRLLLRLLKHATEYHRSYPRTLEVRRYPWSGRNRSSAFLIGSI